MNMPSSISTRLRWTVVGLAAAVWFVYAHAAELPGPFEGGYNLPNGWRITPMGKVVHTEDLPLNIVATPDGASMISVQGGFNPHGLVVIDYKTNEAVQRIPLPTAFLGLAWAPNKTTLYVSGGNNRKGPRAPIYVFDYKEGRLSEQAVRELNETVDPARIYWSGLAHHPNKDILFAANRTASNVVVFDTKSGAIVTRIATEVNPYTLALSADGKTLYCSNWASDSVSVIDTESNAVTATIRVGDNPNDLALTRDGRLFVACANDNSVVVVDTAQGRAVETIKTTLTPRAPEGATPNALALDPDGKTLYVANADNNNVCVVEVAEKGDSKVLGFIPAGWYPSSVAVSPDGKKLYIGNAKGVASTGNIRGPHSPLPPGPEGNGSTKSATKGAITIVDLAKAKEDLGALTKKVVANSPYSDELLAQAKPSKSGPSVIPRKVGVGSPIKHVIYIIMENRTYDQVFGDMKQGNGDDRLTLFGRDVTPNRHAIAEQFVLLDNLFCDAEVSVDGHQWSNAAYATDYIEKEWPADYGGMSSAPRDTAAVVPASGYIWDLCAKKGLTYRSYGEQARRSSETGAVEAISQGLQGHLAPNYKRINARDTDNAAEFIKEFDEYEKNYDSPDPEKRLPNFIVMSLPEDHTHGTRPGIPSPKACVASNDLAVGMILERISHSKYWSELALFIIEDDAQDGADHVDARRTVGLVASPYCKRGVVDSTLYTTSSMLRTIELLLGLQPMSQFDAAANPMYASFGDKADQTPFTKLAPGKDINTMNLADAYGAQESIKMALDDVDEAPMFALNEIIWKSIKGADSPMPLPVHRFQFASASGKRGADRD